MEEKIILKNIDSFSLKDIFECGQCFRWEKENDDSYIGVVGRNVLKVKKDKDNNIIIEGNFESKNKNEIEEFIYNYFDLNRDYKKIKKELSKIDNYMKTAISYGEGIRILNQNLWEMIISYIISCNNNIPRIKKIIKNLSNKYGEEIIFKDRSYYTFPSLEVLEKSSMEDLRKLGLGYRDKYIYKTCKMLKNNKVNLEDLKNKETKIVRKELLSLEGIGPKVADCILLFSTLKRLEVFPIDVWVRRVMNELYIKNVDETKVNKREIEKLANEKFGNLAGIAQQYLFYWKREN